MSEVLTYELLMEAAKSLDKEPTYMTAEQYEEIRNYRFPMTVEQKLKIKRDSKHYMKFQKAKRG